MRYLNLDTSEGFIKENVIDLQAYINGFEITNPNDYSFRVNRGDIIIRGNYHYLPYYKTIDITEANLLGSPSSSGLFYIYVKNKGGGELYKEDFYLSQIKPADDFYGKSYNYLDRFSGYTALYADNYPDYRCIGCIYINDLDSGDIYPFNLALLGYWESKWTDFDAINLNPNSYKTLRHGLGMHPKSWDILFTPDDSLGKYVYQNYYFGSGSTTTSYGVRIGKFITKQSINIRTGSKIYYFRGNGYNGWYNSGYVKWIVRAV